ncbi:MULTISPECIES: type I secretion system permease/ATPase [Caulobacter]|uniref:ATP-binding cassette subfamily C protein n=1 Tax=Caulobacter rhizosphaerae TaxID=2010972 RepID=A0ABU1N243_9CAUL|nr:MULTISPECIES: type I secretion system permease/ATPase [Caulobacter]KQZ18369.1 ABC transporter ATP-binding protein [Caulobacter sp. Root1472]MDR6532393.1 ATP-binding cassette subfamily C protein [Caulobacter rhizosphaerae]
MKFLDAPLPPPLVAALRACRPHLMAAAVFSALINILLLAPTIYMMQVYDRVVPTEGRLTLLYLTLVVAFALGTQTALESVRSRLLTLAGLRLDRLLAGGILQKLMSAMAPGASAQGMREFDIVRQALSGPVAVAAFDIPWTPIYVLVAFMIHPALGAMTIVGGVVLVVLAVLNERATRARAREAFVAQSQAYASQEAAAANGEVVRALGMRGALRERQLADRRAGLDLSAKAQFTGGGYSAATKFTRMFLQSAALGLGAWLAVDKQISAGAIIAASVLMSRALQPIEQLVGSWGVVGQARGALNNLIKLFPAGRGLEVSGTQLPAPSGALALEQVAVRAPGEGPVLLRGVSLRLTPGEILGVIGPSGAGKTTLARVAAGAMTPEVGVVRLDGANMTDWDGDRLGRYIGYVPQDSGLLAGSIKDNISRFAIWAGGDPAIVDAEVVTAAQAAGVHELILRLPKGYDTVLGAGGRGLSAGQAQRVALARALYGQPPLLILDEPNSALDADGEAALNNAILAAKARGAAILIVAHRTGILNVADRLLVLREGQVEMIGPRAEVVAKMAAAAQAAAQAPGKPGSTVTPLQAAKP